MKLYFNTSLGAKLFAKVTRDYYKENGIFPTVNDELPKHLHKLGYRATYFSEYFPDTIGDQTREIQTLGVDMPEEDIIAFRLKYGI